MKPKLLLSPKSNCPLVSVVIPMYNSAQFISQTLECLLYQTMKNFEVVVIDDCSTDNSLEIVESFKAKFSEAGKGLNVLKLPKNTGTPGLPRNIGIKIARGKYISFLDSDDLYTKTALEELTTLAEEYQADAINMSKFFLLVDPQSSSMPTKELLNTEDYEVVSCQKDDVPRLQEVSVESSDLAERVNVWVNSDFHWATCGLFCRRDFLILNKIYFPDMLLCEDQIVQFACLCFAEKLLRVPNITYIVRRNFGSISRQSRTVEEYFHRWLSSLNVGFNEFSKVMKRIPFFSENPEHRLAVLNWFFGRVMLDASIFSSAYEQMNQATLNQLAEKEFHVNDATFAAYLFNAMRIQQLQSQKL